jgi:hypothetical protein
MTALNALLLVWFGTAFGIFLAGMLSSAKRADEQSDRMFEEIRRSKDK